MDMGFQHPPAVQFYTSKELSLNNSTLPILVFYSCNQIDVGVEKYMDSTCVLPI